MGGRVCLSVCLSVCMRLYICACVYASSLLLLCADIETYLLIFLLIVHVFTVCDTIQGR